MDAIIYFIISVFLSFGGGYYVGSTHQKAKGAKELTKFVNKQNELLKNQSLKIDSLMQLPEKVDTIVKIQKKIVYKTDTLIFINKNIMLNTDTIKNELRLFKNEFESTQNR